MLNISFRTRKYSFSLPDRLLHFLKIPVLIEDNDFHLLYCHIVGTFRHIDPSETLVELNNNIFRISYIIPNRINVVFSYVVTVPDFARISSSFS